MHQQRFERAGFLRLARLLQQQRVRRSARQQQVRRSARRQRVRRSARQQRPVPRLHFVGLPLLAVRRRSLQGRSQ